MIKSNYILYSNQTESDDDGLNILHILGIEHRHSGEIQCIVYHPINPVLTQRSCYTDLTVLPRPIQLINVNADPDIADGGFFTVNSASINYTDFHRTTSITQKDYKPIADVPAYLIRGPDDCTALIGGNVCLIVTYGGYPKPSVKWRLKVNGNVLAVSFFFIMRYFNRFYRTRNSVQALNLKSVI